MQKVREIDHSMRNMNSIVSGVSGVIHNVGSINNYYGRDKLWFLGKEKSKVSRATEMLYSARLLLLDKKTEALKAALSFARRVEDELQRLKVLVALSRHLSGGERTNLLNEAVKAARDSISDKDRVIGLSEVAPYLFESGKDLLDEALKIVQSLEDISSQAEALESFSKSLATSVTSIQDNDQTQISDLTSVTLPHHFHNLVKTAYQLTVAGSSEVSSAKSLAYLVPYWQIITTAMGKQELSLFSDTLRAFSKTGRPNCLIAIKSFVPFIAHLGGERAVRETAQAILDTAKWWP